MFEAKDGRSGAGGFSAPATKLVGEPTGNDAASSPLTNTAELTVPPHPFRRKKYAFATRILLPHSENVTTMNAETGKLESPVTLDREGVSHHIKQYAIYATEVNKLFEFDDDAEAEEATTTSLDRPLTPGEHAVSYLVATGMNNKQIAAELDISDQTVKNMVTTELRKWQLSSRDGLMMRGIQNGAINLDLIHAEFDFRLFGALSQREYEVYSKLVDERAPSNIQLADELFVSEQTIKNHMTGILDALHLQNREQVRLFELKRQDRVSQTEGSELQLTDRDFRQLVSLFEGGLFSGRGPTEILQQLNARTIEEAVGHAISFGLLSPNSIGIHWRAQAQFDTLPPDDIQFIQRFGTMKGRTLNRFSRMGVDPEVGYSRLGSIRERLNVSTQQATVLGMMKQVDEYRQRRQKRLEALAVTMGEAQLPREAIVFGQNI